MHGSQTLNRMAEVAMLLERRHGCTVLDASSKDRTIYLDRLPVNGPPMTMATRQAGNFSTPRKVWVGEMRGVLLEAPYRETGRRFERRYQSEVAA
jgi:hypothetical protein